MKFTISKDDKVFTFGANNFGCLGLGHNNVVKELEIIQELCDLQIIDISYVRYYVLALTKSGKCFSYNNSGQLENSTSPKLIVGLIHEKIISIML
jgi:alpha-tubulin suppressor-like RCC1 family protein